VVELTLPAIAAAAGPGLKKITVLGGGAGCGRPAIPPLEIPVVFVDEAACDYFPGQPECPGAISEKIRAALTRAMPEADQFGTLIWFQNPALARNAMLCVEIARFSQSTRAALLLHHHDFWCAGRWDRWSELQQCGCTDLRAAAGILFASGTRSAHAVINTQDFQPLGRFFPKRAFLLPNPVVESPLGNAEKSAAARNWLSGEVKSGAPLWIYPTRFLRRKNLLEAVLLTRWLRPEAILATTSGGFSPDEAGYARDIKQAAKEHGWRVHFGLLDKPGSPGVGDMLQCAEAVVHTSVQEGFGMTFVEATAAGVPLVARKIPAVMPDLEALGFQFPRIYDDILVPPVLFDANAETRRQALLADAARRRLPEDFQKLFPSPDPNPERPFAFSRLTRHAQIEVLARPPEESWGICRHLNPVLENFRSLPLASPLPPTRPPHSPARYAELFLQIAKTMPREPIGHSMACEAQMEIATLALQPDAVFPIQLEK